ncbi:MAG: UDP-glucose 4-epimerase GalE [Acidobacteriota bacterium]
MAILVTGGAGYIGSVTVSLLRARGEEVVILDDLYRGHREALDPAIPFYQGKVQDAALVARIAREHRIDACVHFAALIEAGESVKDPATYFENNTAQGMAFLRALIEAGVKRLVFSSTAAVYGEPRETPITEDHPQWPTNPYGWTKFMMERVLETYDRAYGLKFVALRYFNAAGATAGLGEHHDPETHLIPNVLKVALGRRTHISVFGSDYPTPDGTCVRDYIHVADLASAHLLALDYLKGGGASERINLGNGKGYSVLEVVEAARKITGRAIEARMEPRRAGDPSVLVAGAEKARRVLGWKPACPRLEDIIGSAWQWHNAHPNGYSARKA